jgi:hypothetical protein
MSFLIPLPSVHRSGPAAWCMNRRSAGLAISRDGGKSSSLIVADAIHSFELHVTPLQSAFVVLFGNSDPDLKLAVLIRYCAGSIRGAATSTLSLREETF